MKKDSVEDVVVDEGSGDRQKVLHRVVTKDSDGEMCVYVLLSDSLQFIVCRESIVKGGKQMGAVMRDNQRYHPSLEQALQCMLNTLAKAECKDLAGYFASLQRYLGEFQAMVKAAGAGRHPFA